MVHNIVMMHLCIYYDWYRNNYLNKLIPVHFCLKATEQVKLTTIVIQ